MDTNAPVRYLNAKGAAAYLGISVFSIYRLVDRRSIPFVALQPSGGKVRPSLRFDIQELQAWMRKQAVKPVPQGVDLMSRQDPQ